MLGYIKELREQASVGNAFLPFPAHLLPFFFPLRLSKLPLLIFLNPGA